MYISRVELDTSRNATRLALGNLQTLHAAVEACFSAESTERKLWRIDLLRKNLYLLIVSQSLPDFGSISKQFCVSGSSCETKDYSPLLNSIETGKRFAFRFRGNPVSCVSRDTLRDERGKVMPHITAAQKCEWFSKKAVASGFSLGASDFWLAETGRNRFYREDRDAKRKNRIEVSYAVFEGELTVTDADLFVNALTQGIGKAKAYGCGMLTVVKPR